MTIESIVKAVQAGDMTPAQATHAMSPFVNSKNWNSPEVRKAFEIITGMAEEPDELPENVKDTLRVTQEDRY